VSRGERRGRGGGGIASGGEKRALTDNTIDATNSTKAAYFGAEQTSVRGRIHTRTTTVIDMTTMKRVAG